MGFFIFCIIVTKHNFSKLNKKASYDSNDEVNEEFALKYSFLWELFLTNVFFKRNFKVLFSLMKFLICLSLVLAHDIPAAQITLIMLTYLAFMCIIVFFRPYQILRSNCVSFITITGLFTIHLMFLILITADMTIEAKLDLGMAMIVILSFILFINMVDVLIEVIKNIKTILSRIRYCGKKDSTATPEKSEEKYQEIEVGQEKSVDRTKDMSELRVLKDLGKDTPSYENDERLSEKSPRKKFSPSPHDQKDASFSKANEIEELARHKTSMDDTKQEPHKKAEKKLSLKPQIVIPSVSTTQQQKELDLNKVNLFLNSKNLDKGYKNPTQIHHLQREGVELAQIKGKRAKGEHTKKNSPGQYVNVRENSPKTLGFESPHLNKPPMLNMSNVSSNVYSPSISQTGSAISIQSDLQKSKNISPKTMDMGNKESPKKNIESSHFGKFNNPTISNEKEKPVFPKINFQNDFSTQDETSGKRIPQDFKISLKHVENSRESVLSQSMMKKAGENETKDTESLKIQPDKAKNNLTEKLGGKMKDSSSSLAKELNTIIEEPEARGSIDINVFSKPLQLKEKSGAKPSLTYSKSTFGLNPLSNPVNNKKPSEFNKEIMGLIDEIPEDKPRKKTQPKEKKESELKPKTTKRPLVFQDEIVFEPLENVYKKQKEKNKVIDRKEEKFDFSLGLNYFLTEKSPSGSSDTKNNFTKVNTPGVCIKDTWSKGMDFFFLTQGEKVQVLESNGEHLKCSWKGKMGLFLSTDIILPKNK